MRTDSVGQCDKTHPDMGTAPHSAAYD